MRDILEAYSNIGIELNSFSEAKQMFENDNIDDNGRISTIANLINRCVKELKYLKSEVRKDNEQYQNYISWSQGVCETAQEELMSQLADLIIKYPYNKNSSNYMYLFLVLINANRCIFLFQNVRHFLIPCGFYRLTVGVPSDFPASNLPKGGGKISPPPDNFSHCDRTESRTLKRF